MQGIRNVAQESAEDIFFGQVVLNWARWFIIAGGVFLILWTETSELKMVIGILPLVALMAFNFFLHGRYWAQQPANPALITLASLADIAVITGIILFWSEPGGLASQFFIMYYPVVLAFAFVMPRTAAVPYTILALAAYVAVCVLADASTSPDVASMALTQAGPVKVLIARVITLGAMGALGTYYWRVQRNRRRAVAV